MRRVGATRERVERGGEAQRLCPLEVPGTSAQQTLGNRGVVQLLRGLQGALAAANEPAAIRDVAGRGVRTPASRYPHAEVIGRSFGRHGIGGLKAHLGEAAASSAAAIHAEAYTFGDHVVFSRPPDLRTAAHEAAHAIQQRAGVALPGGVGRAGDRHEQGADEVAEQVVLGRSAEPLLDRHVRRGAASADAAVQRLIRFSFTEWLNKQVPNKALVGTFWRDFVDPELQLAKKSARGEGSLKAKDEDASQDLTKAHNTLKKEIQTSQWDKCVGPMDALVGEVNKVLDNYMSWGEKDLDSYSNKRDDSWKTDPTQGALQTLERLVTASGLPALKAGLQPKSQKAGQPDIPGIKWSAARVVLPSALRNLIRDIYTSWSLGRVMDERSETAQSQKEKNPKEPATLRSWHMNEQGQLPDISRGEIPENAQPLHTHYTKTSQKPYEKEADGPIGYAEYTGTGLMDDAHNSKLVLDYKSGLVYLTVTHYQLYDRSRHEVPVYTQKNKSPGSGAFSAWFYFDMTQ